MDVVVFRYSFKSQFSIITRWEIPQDLGKINSGNMKLQNLLQHIYVLISCSLKRHFNLQFLFCHRDLRKESDTFIVWNNAVLLYQSMSNKRSFKTRFLPCAGCWYPFVKIFYRSIHHTPCATLDTWGKMIPLSYNPFIFILRILQTTSIL